ncbi:hypothetical protein IGI84_003075 [Enterococcus sp. DIV0008]
MNRLETTQSQITVSGNIISELSEKIPNNIIALNELIKNSYDAGSPWVEIILDSEKKNLIVRDSGTGMDIDDVNKLFHISSSEKEYGHEIEVNGHKRLIQGSKGLGFLSVFKFGRKVKWKTKKQEVLEFSVDFNKLIKEYNVSDYPLAITHFQKEENETTGTEISVEIDEYNIGNLKEYLSDKVNLTKILNSFISKKNQKYNEIIPDPNFIIKLIIDGNEYRTNTQIDLAMQHETKQFLRVKFSSIENKINYFYKNELLYSEDFVAQNEGYLLNLDIQTYILESYGKKKINELFYNPISLELTPLLYVNNNLFNNYSIFDTGVMKPIKTSLILSQMIGYVSVTSSDPRISFNSDRTQFSQNSLTDDITNSIKELNKRIQTTGSTIKNELNGKTALLNTKMIDEEKVTDEFDTMTLVKSDVLLKSHINTNINSDKIEYNLFGKSFSVEIIKKQKKKKDIERKFYLGEIDEEFQSGVIKLRSNAHRKIFYETAETDEINFNKCGQWIIKDEMEDEIVTTTINIIEPDPPQVKVKISDVKLHHEYKYDDLFTVINSFGEKDKGVKLDVICDESDVNNQKSRGLITFDSIREVKLNIILSDKKTSLKHEIEAYFRVIDPSKEIQSTFHKQDFIKMPVSQAHNLPTSIKAFVTELNELALNDNFSYTFVSSVRTLVELLVIDILNNRGIPKEENLSDNYELVVKDYAHFVQLITDNKDRQIISGLIKSIGSKAERDSFLAFLNLSTHGSSRIISKSEVMNKTRELTTLLEYLNALNS